MSVVAAALRLHSMHTLMYVDDLLITCSSFEGVSRVSQLIEDTILTTGIVLTPVKGCLDTLTQTLTDRLDFIISTLDKVALRVPERSVSRGVVKRVCCFSRKPRIVSLSTPTSFVGSRGQPSLP
jgi:hypothetical protein